MGKPKYKPKKFSKLSFGRTKTETDGKKKNVVNKSILRADGNVVFENIPEVEYKVNGRTPIEWAVDRYKKSTDKESGITNDATDVDLITLAERLAYVGTESDRLVSLLPKEFEPKEWKEKKTGLDSFISDQK